MKMTKEDLDNYIRDTVIEVLRETPADRRGDRYSLTDSSDEEMQKRLHELGMTSGYGKSKFDFDERPKACGDFKSFQDFLRAVASHNDRRLIKAAGDPSMEIGDPEAGGFMVPEGYRTELLIPALEDTVLLSRVRKINMRTQVEKQPRVVETSHASDLYGGIVVYWTDELGQKQAKKPKLGEIQLKAKDLTGLVYVSDSMLEDSRPSVQNSLEILFKQSMKWYLEDSIVNGSGAGQPLGIMGSSALYEQAKESGQAANTIVYQNLTKMYSRLHPGARSGAIWIFHPTAIPELLTMSLAVGTGGSAVYVSNAALSPPEKIFGLPVYYSEHCATLGSKGDALLVNPKYYVYGLRSDLRMDASIHLKFEYNQTAFRFVIRCDGQPICDETLTLKDGSTEVAPFITLAERS